ncbi:4-alpha-glucanotransferase [Chlamydiota bacterium]
MSNEIKNILSQTPSAKKWEHIGFKKRAGVLTPLFSLFSKNSIGIGEFPDLKLFVDWCKKCGLSIIQLLPMNEMGPLNCPYDAESSFALDPVYLSLNDVIAHIKSKKTFKNKLADLKKRYPCTIHYVNYEIKENKVQLLYEIFSANKTSLQNDFNQFIDQNSYWLNDFALFKVLKEHFNGKPWYEWEAPHKNRDLSFLNNFEKDHHNEVLFQKWLQWLTFVQFIDVKEYAKKHNLLLKGDLPILVSRDSADVWAHPHYFKLDFASGAPPDMYASKGQRWGMPPYNWEQIATDNYCYFKEKLAFAEHFYHMLRIDHVVGLFRIWSIPQEEPKENHGLHGFFDPYDEGIWKEHGNRILSMINDNTSMLLCAEDLGIIPPACPQVLNELGIPGNNVQRWTKIWADEFNFISSDRYRLLCVAMLSTHDTTNFASWWSHEANTIDQHVFKNLCSDHHIDFHQIKHVIFDEGNSLNGRLRWKKSIDSPEALCKALQKQPHEIPEIIENFKKTAFEKEKLWNEFKTDDLFKESCSPEVIKNAYSLTLQSNAIFCIETLIDLLFLHTIITDDPMNYRINKPGTISNTNWSLRIPIGLEDLLTHPVTKIIGKLNINSGR